MWQAQVFTLYPEIFPGPLSKGLYGKALSNNLWKLKVVNIRDAADDKHKTVDDTPYGGGSGMLLKADVLHHGVRLLSGFSEPLHAQAGINRRGPIL